MPSEYRCSIFSMNSCVLALVADASATIATIRATTVSDAARQTRTRSAPVPLLVPANTSFPGFLAAGRGSPVMVAWSTYEAPPTTVPSTGMRAPGFTSTRSPACNASRTTSRTTPSRRTVADRGR